MRTPSHFAGALESRRPSHLIATLALFALLALPAVAFSADTVVGTVPVGDSPEAVAVDPVAHHVYVANFYGDSVSVIDGVADSVDATVPMPTGGSLAAPIAIVADALTGKAYVGNFWSNYVSVISPALSVVGTISPPASHAAGVRALALDPSGATPKVYAAIYGKMVVSVIDAATDTLVKNIPVGDTPRALAVLASGSRHRVYVANRYSNNVSIIDGATDSVVATVPTGAGPKVIAVDPDRGFAYVTSPASDTVTVIDDTDAATATIAVGDNPVGVAVDSVHRRVFVADYNQNAITVIDADTLSVVGTVPTGSRPYAVAVDQTAGKVFVTCYMGDAVVVIDPVTLGAVTVPVGLNPYALGIDEGLAVHKTFVGNWGSNDVSIIDPATGVMGPVSASVDPLPGDATATASPVLTGSAASARAPLGSSIVAVFYRVDDDPTWHRAALIEGAGTPSVRWRSDALAPLAEGPHRVEVAAMDQALAASTSSDQGSGGASAALGSPSAYSFTVGATPPQPPSTSVEVSPASPDGDAGWYLTQPAVTLTPEPAAPTLYAWDATPFTAYTSPLAAPVGAHTLSYLSGDEEHGFEATASLTFSYDPTAPYGPVLSDVSHTPGVWSRSTEIAVALSGAGDADSGLAGFSAEWSDAPDGVPGGPFGLGPLTSSVSTSAGEGSWYLAVRARDVAGNAGPVVRSGPYLVDTTAPRTTSQVVPRYDGSVDVLLTAQDELAGVAVTRWRLDGGSWSEGTVVRAAPGSHTLEYASVDRAGNEETTVALQFTVIARYEETAPGVTLGGRWNALSDPRLSGGAGVWTEKRGAYVEVTFTGTSVQWIAPTGPAFGVARVRVDDGSAMLVDLYSPESTYGRSVWDVSGLEEGTHTLRIECTGTRNKPSRGTRIAVDAFDIDGAPVVAWYLRSPLDMTGIRLYTRDAN